MIPFRLIVAHKYSAASHMCIHQKDIPRRWRQRWYSVTHAWRGPSPGHSLEYLQCAECERPAAQERCLVRVCLTKTESWVFWSDLDPLNSTILLSLDTYHSGHQNFPGRIVPWPGTLYQIKVLDINDEAMKLLSHSDFILYICFNDCTLCSLRRHLLTIPHSLSPTTLVEHKRFSWTSREQ